MGFRERAREVPGVCHQHGLHNAIFEIGKIPREYERRRRRRRRRRRSIETGYRDTERTRPKTTSQNAPVRMFLFFMALVMYNLWVISVARSAAWHGSYDTAAIQLVIMLEYMSRLSVGLEHDD